MQMTDKIVGTEEIPAKFRLKRRLIAITDIRLVEGHFLPCDLLNPVHSLSAGIIQIVKNDHLMPFV